MPVLGGTKNMEVLWDVMHLRVAPAWRNVIDDVLNYTWLYVRGCSFWYIDSSIVLQRSIPIFYEISVLFILPNSQ